MEIDEIFTWAENTKISKEELTRLLHKTPSWRNPIR
jgi:hypothetical protein